MVECIVLILKNMYLCGNIFILCIIFYSNFKHSLEMKTKTWLVRHSRLSSKPWALENLYLVEFLLLTLTTVPFLWQSSLFSSLDNFKWQFSAKSASASFFASRFIGRKKKRRKKRKTTHWQKKNLHWKKDSRFFNDVSTVRKTGLFSQKSASLEAFLKFSIFSTSNNLS